MLNDAIVLEQEQKLAEATLNAALARPPTGPFGPLAEEPLERPLFTFEQLEPILLEARPDLSAARAAVESARSDVALARRQYFPDLMVRLTYKDMAMGQDFWAAMAAIDIPIAPWSGGRYGGRAEEASLNVSRAEAELEAMRIQAELELEQALVAVRTNRERALLFRNTVIPQAHQTLQATVAAYQANRTDFLNLLDSYRVLLARRLDSFRAAAEYLGSIAELERTIGLTLEEIAEKVKAPSGPGGARP